MPLELAWMVEDIEHIEDIDEMEIMDIPHLPLSPLGMDGATAQALPPPVSFHLTLPCPVQLHRRSVNSVC